MQTSQPNILERARMNLDWIAGAALGLISLFIYLGTLAPSVAYMFDDSLEFQLLASRMAIAHPTGYPLYSLVIKLATFLPFGDVAYRVNLVSALSGAGAVMFVYLAARLLTQKFMDANSALGEILTRVPAVVAALVFAFGETFWSQAILAEVYALQALLMAVMLWLVLQWGTERGNGKAARVSLVAIVLLAGLMLTHHRMSVLLYPAIAVYVLAYDRTFLKQPRTLLKLVLAFLLPLLLYLYLPIRGLVTSSLDGAYQNTPAGFLNWVLGTAYTVFLSQNPLNQARDAGYYINLFINNYGAIALLAAMIGFVALFLRAWREWLLLTLTLIANLGFALTYRVADVDVFFIPSFLLVALFVAAGLASLLWLAYYGLSSRAAMVGASVGALLFLLVPVGLLRAHAPRVDLSNKRDIIDYGTQVMSAPLPANATVIGILGEMSLLRYLQDTEHLRPDVETLAADKEDDRTLAVSDAIKRGRTVFLTRPLKGLEKQNSLTSLGALIQVQPNANRTAAPNPTQALNADFGDVKLLGANRATGADGKERLTLYWQPQKKIGDARLISLKLIDAQGNLAGQLDRQPVLDAYPTNAWRNGEYIADAYDVPVFVGATPGDYGVQVTMYDPTSGKVFGQQELGRIAVAAQTQTVPRELLGVSETVVQDLGGVELSGYDFDVSDAFMPGASVPLTLLWRMLQGGTREYDVTLADEFGKTITTVTKNVTGEAGQYVRQDIGLALPANVAPGKYVARVTLHGGLALPWQPNAFTFETLKVRAP